MKTMVLSGVLLLASAGLALATVAAPEAAATKSETATLVSVAPAEIQATITSKKADLVERVTDAAADCSATPDLPLCAEMDAKN
jgi:hypothetical protein